MKKKLARLVAYAGSASAILYASTGSVLATGASTYLPSNPVGTSSNLIDFIKSTLNLVIGLAGLIAVGFLVFSGIRYILAAGDDGKVQEATKGITYSIVGLVICFISVLIVNFVLERVLGAA